MKTTRYEAIVLGVSAGGLRALSTVLPEMPEDFGMPVIVVQHVAADSDGYLAEHLNARCALRVGEPLDKEPIQPGNVYLAPAGYHLLVERERTFALSVDPPVNHARPSIDVLFESAADAYRHGVVGVVMTGASADGSRGLARIKEHGGLAIVQDPATAESNAMPLAAISATEVDHVLALEEVGPFLRRLRHGESHGG